MQWLLIALGLALFAGHIRRRVDHNARRHARSSRGELCQDGLLCLLVPGLLLATALPVESYLHTAVLSGATGVSLALAGAVYTSLTRLWWVLSR